MTFQCRDDIILKQQYITSKSQKLGPKLRESLNEFTTLSGFFTAASKLKRQVIGQLSHAHTCIISKIRFLHQRLSTYTDKLFS